MYNSKEINVISTATKPKSKDIIIDSEGQRKYPGKVTKIPGNTMSTDGYGYIPLYVVPDKGDPKMIYPNTGEHSFPGASSFTEYPQMKKGGQGRDINRKLPTSNPATGVNDLMRRNIMIYNQEGKHRFVPPMKDGGDGFYVQSKDAEKLRHDTPINFVPVPYAYGGASNGPIGYFLPGGENSNEKLYYEKMGGPPCHECGGPSMNMGGHMTTYPNGGNNPSPMNYGAFPVVLSGGDITNIVHGLAKKQYGGGDQNQPTSIDNIIEHKKNFFNNYIRNNVSKSIANEVALDLQKQPGIHSDNAFKQMGGNNKPFPWEDPNNNKGAIMEADPYDLEKYWEAKATQQIPTQGATSARQEDRYFSTTNPYANQQNINGLVANPNLATDNLNAPQAPVINNTIMDTHQMRTDRPNPIKIPAPVKQKNNFDGKLVASGIIGGMNIASHVLEARANAKWDRANSWRTSGDSIFGSQPQGSQSRGDYDPNSGMFRPDQNVPVQFRGYNQGNVGYGFYAQMGGANPDNESDEQWLDEEEIEQIKKMGGKVTFLD